MRSASFESDDKIDAVHPKSEMEFLALPIAGELDLPLPASSRRDWMEELNHRFAYRCLPMVIANQAGWVIENPRRFTVEWDGQDAATSCLRIEANEQDEGSLPTDHFGGGILTFHVPFILRTVADVGVLVRGLPNYFKVNAYALEGYVETDWSSASFTMNWKILEPNRMVTFEKGDPICFIQPFSLDLLERQRPQIGKYEIGDPFSDSYAEWAESRREFLSELPNQSGAPWQKDYFKGEGAANHRTRVHLRKFEY